MKIRKVENLVANLHDKTEYVIHITNIKSWISFEKVHNVIKFNQNAWLYPYFDMNTDLRKKKKKYFKKIFLFSFLSEPDHHNTKFFTEKLLVIEMKKSEILMNESV